MSNVTQQMNHPTQILCKTSSYLYLHTSCTKLLFLESVHDIQTQILAKRSILLNVTHAQQITQQRSSAKHLHFIPAQKPHQIVPQNLHMKSKYRYRQKINSLGPAKTGRKFLSPLKTNRHYSENWKHVWWQPLLERKVQDVSVCWSQQNFVSQISSQLLTSNSIVMMLNSVHSNVQMVCSKDSKLCFLNPRNMLLPMKQGQGVSTKVMMMGFNSSKVFQMVCSKWFQVVFSKPLKYACPWKGDHDVVQFLKDFTQRSEDHRNYITQESLKS